MKRLFAAFVLVGSVSTGLYAEVYVNPDCAENENLCFEYTDSGSIELWIELGYELAWLKAANPGANLSSETILDRGSRIKVTTPNGGVIYKNPVCLEDRAQCVRLRRSATSENVVSGSLRSFEWHSIHNPGAKMEPGVIFEEGSMFVFSE